jgi:hypothetical protein
MGESSPSTRDFFLFTYALIGTWIRRSLAYGLEKGQGKRNENNR